MIYQVIGRILKNKKVTPTTYYLELDIPKISNKLQPGQFLHIRVNQAVDPLLRRPLSINKLIRRKKGKGFYIGIIYKVIGHGTWILAQRHVGETVDVLGPLGNGFNIHPKLLSKRPILLVAGGMGIAPFVFLVDVLKKKSLTNLTAFIGTQTRRELLSIGELKKLGCKVKIATDDGSCGYKGYVSGMVEDFLTESMSGYSKLSLKQANEEKAPYIFACGPGPMLEALDIISRKFGIPGQVSLDEMLGCGVGACLGCVVKTKNAEKKSGGDFFYKRICKDGPVFDINEIVWEDG